VNQIMNQIVNPIERASGRSPFQQLLILEERVRLSGSTLPRTVDARVQWAGVKSRIAGTDFIFRLHDIVELLDRPRITPIPRCASWVKGAVNLRGRVLPVYDAAEYFNLPADHNAVGNRVVVIEKGPVFCGLVVDKVFGMQKFFQEHFVDVASGQSVTPAAFAEFTESVTRIEGGDWYLVNLLRLARKLYDTNPARAARTR
jgi:twitching motility protein PilI